jgi:hypothetical protein
LKAQRRDNVAREKRDPRVEFTGENSKVENFGTLEKISKLGEV